MKNTFFILFIFMCAIFEVKALQNQTQQILEINNDLENAKIWLNNLDALYKIFNSNESVFTSYSNILSLVKSSDIILAKGINLTTINDPQTLKQIKDLKTNFCTKLDDDIGKKLQDFKDKLTTPEAQIEFGDKAWWPLYILQSSFCDMIGFLSVTSINTFGKMCKWSKSNEIISEFEIMTITDEFENYIAAANYTDEKFQLMNTVVDMGLKSSIMLNAFCRRHVYNYTTPLNEQIIIIKQRLEPIEKFFNYMEVKRKDLYWKDTILMPLIKPHVNGSETNEKIADNIYKFLESSYGALGFNYFVGVSNVHTGTEEYLLGCKEIVCKTLYNYNSKNVYIMRNLKAKTYAECRPHKKLLDKNAAKEWCKTNINSKSDLREINSLLINSCNKTSSIIVLKKLDFQSHFSGGFQQDCVNLSNKFLFFERCFGEVCIVTTLQPEPL